MNDQLVLLQDEEARRQASYCRLDEHTREVGRRGIALAREALRQAAAASADRAAA